MQDSFPDTPGEVMEYILDETASGIFEDGYVRLLDCLSLPHEVESFDGFRRMETPTDLRDYIDRMRVYYRSIGVTDLVRRVLEAEFRGPDTVVGTHETRLVGNGVLLADPYPVFSEVRRIDGKWRLISAKYGTTDRRMLLSALRATG